MRKILLDAALAALAPSTYGEVAGFERVAEREAPPTDPKIDLEVPQRARAPRANHRDFREFRGTKANASGSTRCLCGCGEMVSGSRKFKMGHTVPGEVSSGK